MSSERTEEHLEAMLAALRGRPARLDEIAQARVRARLEAALVKGDVAELRRVGRWQRRGVVAAVGLAMAAAVFAVIVAARGRGPATGEIATAGRPQPIDGSAALTRNHGAGAGTGAAGNATAAPIEDSAVRTVAGTALTGSANTAGTVSSAGGSAAGAVPSAGGSAAGAVLSAGGSAAIVTGAAVTADGATTPIMVAAGESAQLTVGGAAVTVYGPGRLSPTPDGAAIEAAGIVVDRTHGDTPWSVRYHGVKVVATHAMFALDHGAQARVSVVRGEVVLSCPSGARTIHAGASASCERAVRAHITPHTLPAASSPEPPQMPDLPAHVTPHTLPAASSPEPPQVPDLPARLEPTVADWYSVAESALRRGDLDAARDALLAIIDAAPDSLDAATALLDLARLAAASGDTSSASGYLDRLDRHPRHAGLAMPAARLRASFARSDIIRTPLAPVEAASKQLDR